MRFLRDRKALYLLCMLVGAVAGLGAVAFEYLTALIAHFALVRGAGYVPAGPRGELHLLQSEGLQTLSLVGLLLLPALGGFLSNLLCLGDVLGAVGGRLGLPGLGQRGPRRAGRARGRAVRGAAGGATQA